jgi:hypothetical protein
MYLTHTFAHRETLSRAYSWLTHLGFHPRRVEANDAEIARLMIPVDPHRLAAAQMVINAVESADVDGFPSFWDKTQAHHGSPVGLGPVNATSISQGKPRSSVIGWHPLD